MGAFNLRGKQQNNDTAGYYFKVKEQKSPECNIFDLSEWIQTHLQSLFQVKFGTSHVALII